MDIKKLLVSLVFATAPAWAADSAILYNVTDNRIEYSRNVDQVRSIASITKLMTAMITLDYDRDLSRKLTLSPVTASHLPRQEYTREQLLNAMLIQSDNAAAETLAADYPGGRSAFVSQMNHQAQLWGMTKTHFADPSGLGVFNISTVRDVANMVHTASSYWFIKDNSGKKQIAFATKNKKTTRLVNLSHTSGPLLLTFDNVVISKTGLTNSAGWCVGMLAEHQGRQYIVVVLGSKNKKERLDAVKNIRHNHLVDTNLYTLEIPATY